MVKAFLDDRVRKVSQEIRVRKENRVPLVCLDRKGHVDSLELLEQKVFEAILESQVLEFQVRRVILVWQDSPD